MGGEAAAVIRRAEPLAHLSSAEKSRTCLSGCGVKVKRPPPRALGDRITGSALPLRIPQAQVRGHRRFLEETQIFEPFPTPKFLEKPENVLGP